MLANTIHPGDFLKEELAECGISQSMLAQHIGVAKSLARALGTTPELWMNLQSSYELAQVKDPDFGKLRA